MAAVPITDLAFANSQWTEVRGQLAEAAGIYDVVYFDASVSKWRLADASGTAAEAGSDGIGICLNEVVNVDDWAGIVTGGKLIINSAGFTAGRTYCVGGVAAGSIEVDADVNTGGYRKTTLFVAQDVTGTTQQVTMNPVVSGVTAS